MPVKNPVSSTMPSDLHPDLVHLLHEIAAVERAGEDETQRTSRPGRSNPGG